MKKAIVSALVFAAVAVGTAATNPLPNPAEVTTCPLDQLVSTRLQKLSLPPAEVCPDAVFIRRAYLDVIATLPTAEEVEAFLEDKNLRKRRALVDRLLERPEFVDCWAMKWCDLLRVKAEFPINLWPNAAQIYHHYLWESIKNNVPYDRLARELLTASGSNFRTAPVNFYRAMQNRDPQGIAQTVALTFMGARADRWPTNQLAGLAAFFSQVGSKSTAEWKEEIVFFDPGKATNGLWWAAAFPEGKPVKLAPDRDPRAVFADWLITPQNPWFTRAIANRVWSWLLGRGIIHEPDDIRPDNPPSNPELLAYLEKELVAAHYDLKHLYRVILNSQTYQRSSIPKTNSPAAAANFAFYPVRRLDAEVVIDALNQITGTTEKYSSQIPEPFTFIPESQRTIALADASVTSPFLELFGRSARDTGMESERNNRATAAQRLHLLNSSHIQRKIQQGPKIKALLQSQRSATEKVTTLYLTILSRYPTTEELQTITAYTKSAGNSSAASQDLIWALVNSAEFLYRH
jgi:hypothetical protein